MQFAGTGTAAFNAIYADMGASGTNNTVNFYNNTVTGCTYSTMTSGTAYLVSLTNMATTDNIYGNTLTNNTFGSSSVTATGAIRYLYCNASPTTTGPITYHDNLVSGNSRIQSAAGGGGTYFMAMAGKCSTLSMHDNTINNNVVAGNGGTYMFYVSADIGSRDFYNNTATNISKAEGTEYGIYAYNVSTNSGTSRFFNNKIDNIEGLTAGSTIFTILLRVGTAIITTTASATCAHRHPPEPTELWV
jgi:hypothetical protein